MASAVQSIHNEVTTFLELLQRPHLRELARAVIKAEEIPPAAGSTEFVSTTTLRHYIRRFVINATNDYTSLDVTEAITHAGFCWNHRRFPQKAVAEHLLDLRKERLVELVRESRGRHPAVYRTKEQSKTID